MIEGDLDWIVQATNGRLVGDPNTHWAGINSDSRSAEPGNLYIALQGEQFDGHDFLVQAQKKGVSAVVVDHEIPGITLPTVIVRNTITALGDIARAHRLQFNIPVVGITGSVGKTSTKEMIACVLRSKFNTLSNEKNFNNEIGVPQTLFQLNSKYEAAVVEMGMRSMREIAELANIARPTMGVITNIGVSHIERLGSIFNIARAKRELLEALPESGTSVLPADDSYFRFLANYASAHGKVVSFGLSSQADFQAMNISFTEEGFPKFEIQGTVFELPIIGVHHIINAACAAAVGAECGIELEQAAVALSGYGSPSMRMETIKSPGGLIILNDAYNAAPDSMRSALETLSLAARGRRKVAILGEMRELGDHFESAHRSVGQFAASAEIDLLITVGERATLIAEEAAVLASVHFATSDEVVRQIDTLLHAGDVVLVKGSRAMQMEKIVEQIRSL